MLTFDPTELLKKKLNENRRPPDGLLHPSSDLVGSLRHTQLSAAGAPRIDSEVAEDMRLVTGHMWHRFLESMLRGKPIMFEVDLTPYLPEGWSGTTDWLVWDDEYKAFVVTDVKTQKAEGMTYIESGGIKLEHLWQASVYWLGAKRMGLPLVNGIVVYYLPFNAPADMRDVQPIKAEGTPIPEKKLLKVMEDRRQAVDAYLAEIGKTIDRRMASTAPPGGYDPHSGFLNDKLAPEQDRVQIVRWNKDQKGWDVKLAPHWSAAYCPYPDELCGCRNQGTTKIGQWQVQGGLRTELSLCYIPRKGYEEIEPEVEPSKTDFKRKVEDGIFD